MADLRSAKSSIRDSYAYDEENTTMSVLNKSFVDKLQAKHEKSPTVCCAYEGRDESSDKLCEREDEATDMTLLETLTMLETMQNFVQEQKEQQEKKVLEDKVTTPKKDTPSRTTLNKASVQGRIGNSKSPWEVVEDETIRDLAATFADVVNINNMVLIRSPTI